VTGFLGVALIVFVGVYLPIKEGAGQTTIINLVYQAILGVNLTLVVSLAANAALLALWIRERRVGMKAVQREHERAEALEKLLDPERTGSGLIEHAIFLPKHEESEDEDG
jgi:hypothetical protein